MNHTITITDSQLETLKNYNAKLEEMKQAFAEIRTSGEAMMREIYWLKTALGDIEIGIRESSITISEIKEIVRIALEGETCRVITG